MLHDDVLAADGVGRVVAPIKYLGDGNASLFLH
jgi:hypothetical protein